MDDFARAAFREREAKQIRKQRGFYVHLSIYAATNVFLVAVWALTGGGYPWFLFPLLGWGIAIVAHGASVFFLADPEDLMLQREQRRLADGQEG